MNLQDVIKACGPLPQIPQNMPGSNKKNNLVYIGAILLVGGIGYVKYLLQLKASKNLLSYAFLFFQ